MERNAKGLTEKRNDIVAQMEAALDKATEETRALTKEEMETFEKQKEEVRAIDATLEALESAERAEMRTATKEAGSQEEAEKRDYEGFLRGDERALTVANNQAIIPTTIAHRIIETLKEICPIYSMATVFDVKGELHIPYYDETETKISAAYVEDMAELTESSGKFVTKALSNYIIGVLTKISKSLIHNQDFDLTGYSVSKVSQAISEMLSKECLIGTADKMEGLLSAKNSVEAAAAAAITADELIDLQMSILQPFQGNACWIMHRDTLKAIRKLKTSDGEYLLNKDITTGFGWSLLGRPVYLDENMPKMEAGAKAIFYGDVSGLALKFSSHMDMELLREKYATQYAVGICAHVECDSKIIEEQKLAVLQMAAA